MMVCEEIMRRQRKVSRVVNEEIERDENERKKNGNEKAEMNL